LRCCVVSFHAPIRRGLESPPGLFNVFFVEDPGVCQRYRPPAGRPGRRPSSRKNVPEVWLTPLEESVRFARLQAPQWPRLCPCAGCSRGPGQQGTGRNGPQPVPRGPGEASTPQGPSNRRPLARAVLRELKPSTDQEQRPIGGPVRPNASPTISPEPLPVPPVQVFPAVSDYGHIQIQARFSKARGIGGGPAGRVPVLLEVPWCPCPKFHGARGISCRPTAPTPSSAPHRPLLFSRAVRRRFSREVDESRRRLG